MKPRAATSRNLSESLILKLKIGVIEVGYDIEVASKSILKPGLVSNARRHKREVDRVDDLEYEVRPC